MFRFFSVAALTVLSLSCAAQADPPAPIRGEAMVRYDDLDLKTPDGAARMLARIERAAVRACGGSPYLRHANSPQNAFLMADYRRCRERAVARAVATLNAPAVGRLHAKTRRHSPDRIAGR